MMRHVPVVVRLALAAVCISCGAACLEGPAPPPPRPAGDAGGDVPATFDELLARPDQVDAFLEGRALPLVEGDASTGFSAIFVYRGGGDVLVAGDFDGWAGTPTERIAGTDVAWLRVTLPADARVDYKLVVDGEWLLDPANPRTCPSGFGDNSELAMPEHEPAPDLAFDPAIGHGTLNGALIDGDALPPALRLASRALSNERDVWIYEPPAGGEGLPLLVVNDGGDYLALAHMQHVLDANLARGDIAPVVVAFVAPVDREAEYVGERAAAYVELVTTELVSFVVDHLERSTLGRERGVWGTSYSGYAAVHVAAADESFTRVASQSGRVLIDGGRAIERVAQSSARVWLDTGTIFDTEEENREALVVLDEGSADAALLTVNEGHSWGSWRARLGPALRALYPPQ